MADFLFTNLSTNINSTTKQISVGSTIDFPASGIIYINEEIIQYTSKINSAFQGITRGYSGTTANSHASQAVVIGVNTLLQIIPYISEELSSFLTRQDLDTELQSYSNAISDINLILNDQSGRENVLKSVNQLRQSLTLLHEHIYNEVPTGTVDGSNKVFTTSIPYKTDSIQLYINRMRITAFEETDTSEITTSSAPIAGSEILIDYIKDV